MSKHTPKQWLALYIYLVFMACLGLMYIFEKNSVVFYTLVFIQALCVGAIGYIIIRWPKG